MANVLSPEKRSALVDLFKAGTGVRAAARALRVDKDAVGRVFRELRAHGTLDAAPRATDKPRRTRRSEVRRYNIFGQMLTIAEMAEVANVTRAAMNKRLRNMSEERAVTERRRT